MSIELPDGELLKLPGTLFSEIGLGGELHSLYELESGSHEDGDRTAKWDATSINIRTDPRSGEADFDGSVGSFSFGDTTNMVTLGELTFSGQQRPTKYGVAVGDVALELAGLSVTFAGSESGGVLSMSVNVRTELDGDEINAEAFVSTVVNAAAPFGEIAFDMAFNLEGADAEALGRVQQTLESVGAGQDPISMFGPVEQDLKRLFASGFKFNLEQLDVALPMGTVSSKMLFEFGEEDPATFDWTTLLLSTEASIDLSIPDAIVQMMLQAEPNMAMAIGAGYLVKRADAYELEAQLKKGLLTVNGAPIPLPVGAVP